MNFVAKVGVVGFFVASCVAGAHAQSFPKIPNLPNIGLPMPSKSNNDSTGKKVLAGGAGCAIGGAGGYLVTKALGDVLQDNGFSRRQVEQTAIAVAGVGCVVGGAAAVKIIENMDEKSKQAEEEAWKTAQAQTSSAGTSSPVVWKSETHEGEVSIEQPENMPDGSQCATRKKYVKTAAGDEAESYTRVCKNASGQYEEVGT